MSRLRRILPLIALALIPVACSRDRGFYSENLNAMEETEYKGQQVSKEKIEALKKDIQRYQQEVEKRARSTEQLGVYYKMLAVRFMQSQMYLEAYRSLQEAIAVFPENSILFYLSGVCAARVAKAQVETAERAAWLQRAESLYRRAVDLQPAYTDALYGLSVLLVFELDRPEEAEEPLLMILQKEKKNIAAMSLLGNLYYRLGRLEEALKQYQAVMKATNVERQRQEAQDNIKRIEAELHGSQ